MGIEKKVGGLKEYFPNCFAAGAVKVEIPKEAIDVWKKKPSITERLKGSFYGVLRRIRERYFPDFYEGRRHQQDYNKPLTLLLSLTSYASLLNIYLFQMQKSQTLLLLA